MKNSDIVKMLEKTELPFTYYQFPEKEAPPLPYLIYWFPGSIDFAADNKNYVSINNLHLELYTDNKDFDTESRLESVLAENNIFYVKTESYLSSESMYMVLYETSVLISKED